MVLSLFTTCPVQIYSIVIVVEVVIVVVVVEGSSEESSDEPPEKPPEKLQEMRIQERNSLKYSKFIKRKTVSFKLQATINH